MSNLTDQKEINKLVSNYVSKERSKTITLLKSKISQKKKEIKEFNDLILKEKEDLKNALRDLQSKKNSPFNKLKKLSFVNKVSIYKGTIKIYTKDLIVNKNKNFGPYQIIITNQTLRTLRLDGSVKGCQHCFVDGNGNICFGRGDVKETINQWKKSGLYHLIASVVWDTLSNVKVGSNPYISLPQFYENI